MRHHRHSALFYEGEDFFLDSVATSLLSALGRGQAAVLVCSRDHLHRISHRIRKDGLPVEDLTKDGRLSFRDAQRLLRSLVTDGWPTVDKFETHVARLVRRKMEKFPGLWIFGEMVDLLWQADRKEAAVELESLWNGLLATQPVSLECSYRIDPLDTQVDLERFAEVCGAHEAVQSHPDPLQLRRAFFDAVRQAVPTRYVEMLESWIANGGFRHDNHVCESVVWLRRYMPELAGRVLKLTRTLLNNSPSQQTLVAASES